MKRILLAILGVLALSTMAFADVTVYNNGSLVGRFEELNFPTGTTTSQTGMKLTIGLTTTLGNIDAAAAGALTVGASTATSLAIGNASAASNFVGDLTVGSTLFTVAHASGNTAISGTLAVTGAQTSTGAIYANGGLDRSTSAALAIGATNASVVNVTPPAVFLSTVQGPGTQGYSTYTIRQRVPIASVNSGVTLVAAVTGRKIRVVDAEVIAYGGAVTSTTATGVAITGTQTSPVALFTIAKAQLGESVLNRFGTASTTLLADGASLIANDAATAITFKGVGGTDLAGATGIDVILTYAIE